MWKKGFVDRDEDNERMVSSRSIKLLYLCSKTKQDSFKWSGRGVAHGGGPDCPNSLLFLSLGFIVADREFGKMRRRFGRKMMRRFD